MSSTDVFSPWHSSSKLGSDGLGYLLHRGEENQHAHCCQHAAVYLTDGRSDEPAYDEQEAGDEGDIECTHGNIIRAQIWDVASPFPDE